MTKARRLSPRPPGQPATSQKQQQSGPIREETPEPRSRRQSKQLLKRKGTAETIPHREREIDVPSGAVTWIPTGRSEKVGRVQTPRQAHTSGPTKHRTKSIGRGTTLCKSRKSNMGIDPHSKASLGGLNGLVLQQSQNRGRFMNVDVSRLLPSPSIRCHQEVIESNRLESRVFSVMIGLHGLLQS